MNYNEIISVSKLPGLYHVNKQRMDGLILNSLIDGKTTFVSSRAHNFTPLENITIYTNEDPISLLNILLTMKSSKEAMPSAKATNDEIKAYFGKIVPNYDQEKVYVSDMQKIVKWYSLLNDKDLIKEDSGEKKEIAIDTEALNDKTGAKTPVKGTAQKTAANPKAKSKIHNTPRKTQ